MSIGGGVRLNVSDHLMVRPDIRALVVFAEGDTHAVGVFGVPARISILRLGRDREEHAMTSSFKDGGPSGTTLLVGGVSVAIAQAPGRPGRGVADVRPEDGNDDQGNGRERRDRHWGRRTRAEWLRRDAPRGEDREGDARSPRRTEFYLTEQGITLAKGDTLEILGSRVTIDAKPILIARQINKGKATWTLRDASGRPLWSGRGGK